METTLDVACVGIGLLRVVADSRLVVGIFDREGSDRVVVATAVAVLVLLVRHVFGVDLRRSFHD